MTAGRGSLQEFAPSLSCRRRPDPAGGGQGEGSILDERAQPVRIGNAQAAIAPFDQSRLLELVQDADHGRAGDIADGRNVFLTDVHLVCAAARF